MRREGRGRVKIAGAAAVLLLTAALLHSGAEPALALTEGAYLVTMHPSYRDPETGAIEDPGNNEAIGQGMTEKLCGPSGLLEVGADGGMHLTVRYYLSQFVRDVSFEERRGGNFAALGFQAVQTRAPVEGAEDIDEKYGYTDYRMAIQSSASVFRGKAYVEPMGRSVVYFFSFTDPVPGSGDFVTEGGAAQSGAGNAGGAAQSGAGSAGGAAQSGAGNAGGAEWPDAGNAGGAARAKAWDGVNGSGAADAPVTGIPVKPAELLARQGSAESGGSAQSAGAAQSMGSAQGGDYRLNTVYDLSQVPMEEARALTAPILAAAVGVTNRALPGADAEGSGAGDGAAAKELAPGRGESGRGSGDFRRMLLLLGISAALLLWFAYAQLSQGRQRQPEAEE